MTDAVPLRDYVDARIASVLLLGAIATVGFFAVMITLNAGNSKATKLALEGQKEATKVALAASDAKGVAHNGLIERMREMAGTYVTRGNVFSFVTALGIAAGIYGLFVK